MVPDRSSEPCRLEQVKEGKSYGEAGHMTSRLVSLVMIEIFSPYPYNSSVHYLHPNILLATHDSPSSHITFAPRPLLWHHRQFLFLTSSFDYCCKSYPWTICFGGLTTQDAEGRLDPPTIWSGRVCRGLSCPDYET